MMTNGRPDVQQAVQRARHAANQARLAAAARAQRDQLRDQLRDTLVREMFARPVRDCARTLAATCRLVSRLTHGRLTDAHDEVLYVIRRPEERFARVA